MRKCTRKKIEQWNQEVDQNYQRKFLCIYISILVNTAEVSSCNFFKKIAILYVSKYRMYL